MYNSCPVPFDEKSPRIAPRFNSKKIFSVILILNQTGAAAAADTVVRKFILNGFWSKSCLTDLED